MSIFSSFWSFQEKFPWMLNKHFREQFSPRFIHIHSIVNFLDKPLVYIKGKQKVIFRIIVGLWPRCIGRGVRRTRSNLLVGQRLIGLFPFRRSPSVVRINDRKVIQIVFAEAQIFRNLAKIHFLFFPTLSDVSQFKIF